MLRGIAATIIATLRFSEQTDAHVNHQCDLAGYDSEAYDTMVDAMIDAGWIIETHRPHLYEQTGINGVLTSLRLSTAAIESLANITL